MGKDTELLEAARNGNILVLEKILNQKAKRFGQIASLRRGPGANVQDSSGYTGLHHAALNGHTDVVRLLLAHDATPNQTDGRGSTPLHLAAWAGHQDIVKLFLTHPHHPANPNVQSIEQDTPLHCAAQHGHTGALTTLLAFGANPNVTNSRHETPLDLAAQYGRLQAVQMLIRAHPELLLPFKASNATNQIFGHSPLHVASRNGHKNVVEVLLAAGVYVNLLTASGTALHEAALCGKSSVVRTLLNSGIDLEAKDCSCRTALDILADFPPHVTKGIVSVIQNYRNSLGYDSESEDVRLGYNHHHQISMSLDTANENRKSPNQSFCNSHHDMTTSPSSSLGSLGPPSPMQKPRDSSSDISEFYLTMTSNKQRTPPPKKPPRRNLSVSPTLPKPGQLGSHAMSMSVDRAAGQYEYIFLARTGDKTRPVRSSNANDDPYVEMTLPVRAPPKPAPRGLPTVTYENTTLKSYNPNRKLKRIRDNNASFGIDFNKDKHEIPQSPTHYQQPPTPEHPPPSAQQAEKYIHDRIRPLSQEYRRSLSILQASAHFDTGVSPQEMLCPSLCASSGSISSSVSMSDRSVSTDCVEEYIGDVPFAGLFKGSTMNLTASARPQERPKTLATTPASNNRNKRSLSLGGVIDNDDEATENGLANDNDCDADKKVRINSYFNRLKDDGGHRRKASLSGDDILSPFNEEDAWAKISEIMQSFGSGILYSDSGGRIPATTEHADLFAFLSEHHLGHLLDVLVEHGFDHCEFLNGILDETDMISMDVALADREALLSALKTLPTAQSLPILHKNNNNSILNVDQWLHSIHLSIYIDIFKKNLYTNMEGVCRVWEVELQTVLEIKKLGHRKRILHSVSGNRQNNSAVVTNGRSEPKKTIARHNNKKNRLAPKPPIKVQSLEIRAPSELLLGLPSNLRTIWRHSANELISGQVKYEVFYLGSTVVKELRGTESTRKSIQKLKRDDRISEKTLTAQTELPQNTHQASKQPVILAISHRGVEFINIESKMTICEHEIRNINCACQDADDLSHFAYITKDADVNTHYCHVFNVESMDLATEIILSLGQAFEVAYQMALRGDTTTTNPTKTTTTTSSAAPNLKPNSQSPISNN